MKTKIEPTMQQNADFFNDFLRLNLLTINPPTSGPTEIYKQAFLLKKTISKKDCLLYLAHETQKTFHKEN